MPVEMTLLAEHFVTYWTRGWLVDLVEGMQGMELWSRPGPAIVSGAPAVPPTAS